MAAGSERHVPVLLQDAIQYLNVRAGGTYVDATLGFAGHASAIVRLLGPQGRFIGFDRDPDALELVQAKFAALSEELGEQMPQWELHGEEFSAISRHIEAGSLDGLLADFGMSSMQLDTAHRGFSFQADGPLDMRMNPRRGGDCRTSGKPGRRKSARRPDLRIRRGKEIAEICQSHCQGTADQDHGAIS